MIAIGDRAPSFSLPSSNGELVESAALKGQPYLLYFYPKADTPGCTTQACDLRDQKQTLASLSLRVIGVSPDPVEKLERFARKYGLDFTLVSDSEHRLADAYGTWVEKSMYGKTYFGMERSSFLVDADGVIRALWRKVKPADHVALVTEAAAEL
ncbi:thioredoxin-dependent thiol peroxidase [Asaia lannensis]|uniref:thioredoxin-dependent peroxiredoxin n=1 Tax=Asaia lannensis NBRC 102526 TaxID=1307926 RepID=A0ABT1CEH2_9PROT|nr:thioredoxin-dependent thiol peroxidase [Asaia lannensis]MCO6159247.1 thioredoxin-dependent thiol peroxidase [Asaia lannensis NBRC 102526]GBQ97310.1 thioredoxin peroxidase [Asaia lannensis NBRC 102526]